MRVKAGPELPLRAPTAQIDTATGGEPAPRPAARCWSSTRLLDGDFAPGTADGMTRQQIILLILSDANTRERAEHHLRQQGFGVFATGETPIALDWLTRHTPDLVVCDLLLPGTRTAITHVLRRKGEARLPRMIGLVSDGLPVNERLRELFGYDDVVSDRTPVAVLTKRLLAGP